MWKRKKSNYRAGTYYPTDFVIQGRTISWKIYGRRRQDFVLKQGKTRRGFKAAIKKANRSIAPARILIREIKR